VWLEIVFENKGGGNPYAPNLPTANCHNSLSLNDIDTVRVSEVSLPGGRHFTCQPSGIIRLNGGRGIVTCSLSVSGDTYFVSPLKIVLDYKYRQSLPKKEITIINYN